ncbi:MAG: hypothetical protein IKO04_02845, partial [Bacteroidales bacterium]|nr:hypothetical protein [Bacteroidales bacterium]
GAKYLLKEKFLENLFLHQNFYAIITYRQSANMRKNTGRARFGPDLLRNRVGEGTLGLDLCFFSSFASSR